MRVANSSTEADISSYWAVVWSLVGRVTRARPSITLNLELVVFGQKCVFLLDTKPRLLSLSCLKDLVGKVSEVGVCRDKILVLLICPLESLTENHDVVTTSEWIWVKLYGFKDYLRHFSWTLICGWTVIVPFWQILNLSDWALESPALSSHFTSSTNPDILGNNLSSLSDVVKSLNSCWNLFHLVWFF